MSDQILNINKEKSDLSDKNLNLEKNKPLETNETKNNNVVVNNINNEIQNTENIPLQLNEKDTYELPPETIEKLNLSCRICQSKNFFLYIPEINASPNSQSEYPEKPTNNNPELQNVNNTNQTYTLPVLICQQKHQFCLLCNQDPHLGSFCKEENLNKDNIKSMIDIIKEVETIPEEKKKVLDSFNENLSQTKGCCSCSCVCYTFLVIFLIFLWTIASIALLVLGLALLFVAYALRLVCCLYHCCYDMCCTSTVTEEDRGDYIVRTTTIHEQDRRINQMEAEEHDDCLVNCAPWALSISIEIIPKGYKKICEWYDNWKEKF